MGQVVRVVHQPTRVVRVASAVGPRGEVGPEGPAGADGREIELGQSATHVQWRYTGDVAWLDVVPLTAITGPAGIDGQDGAAGPAGADGAPGLPGADGAAGAPGEAGTDGSDGAPGADGREVALRVDSGFIQWQYVGGAWTNLVSLAAITGPAGQDGAPGTDGAEGAPGATGPSAYDAAVTGGFIGSEAEWLASLEGPPGPAGADGVGVPPVGADGQVITAQGGVWVAGDFVGGGGAGYSPSAAYRGAWVSGTTYLAGDVVVRGAAVYEALTASTGADPSLPPTSSVIGGPAVPGNDFDRYGAQQILNPPAGTYAQVKVATSSSGTGRVGFTAAKPTDGASVPWLAYADVPSGGARAYRTLTLNTPLVLAEGATVWAVWVGAAGTFVLAQNGGVGVTPMGAQAFYGSTFASGLSWAVNIQAVKTAAPSWAKVVDLESVASAAPTTGTAAVGDRVYNSAPGAGGFVGWVCVVAGTPGTWKTFGAISA